ncbi:MAG TPA: threonine/serine exporter family protein [Anaerolineaceae bacterium]|nr:threonine/serine exporter family protein [Anaerolineaceae bacterium]
MESVERALDVALIVMKNGGTTAMADRTFQNILKGYRQKDVSTAWRLDFVVATRVTQGLSSTALRPVGPIGVNLLRASEAVLLGEQVAKGKIGTAAIVSEVERVNALAPPCNRWVLIVVAACAAAFFSRISGGDWGAFYIVFVAAGVGQFLRSRLQARKLEVVPVTLACGVLSACIAGLGLRLGLSQTVPATAIASVIYMAPGLPLINGFIDMLFHQYLFVGLERITNAAYLFLVLAVAIALANALVM